ncbi:TetR family transcriptional regulator [Nocardioides sp. P5_C9_2]
MANDDPTSPVQRERRTRILDATIALASRGGFEAVQMRAVAEQADVALGTLYRYFPSKIHLLVSALAREFERADASMASNPVPGDTAADRVVHVLHSMTRGLQDDQHLTEALTRAFMFADRSAASEINAVGALLVRILTGAMRGDGDPARSATDDELAIARVVGDVWLATLMAWVTGRNSADEASAHLERAVRLVLR